MPVRVLWRYLARYRTRYLAGFVLLLLTNLCALGIPWVIKGVIEAIGAGASPEGVAAGALLIVALAVAQGVTRAASRLALLGASQRVETDVRNDLVGRLLRLSPAFYQGRRTGDLMSRATSDLQAVAQLVGFGTLSLANTALVYLGTLIAMLRIDPLLTVAALTPYPVLVLVAARYNRRVHAETLAVQEELARLTDKAQENLAGAAAVRAYTLEAREIEAFGRLNAEYLARVLRQARTQAIFSPLMGSIAGLGTLTVLWLGGREVAAGRLGLGGFVAFASYLGALAWPTLALGWVLGVVRRGLAAMERVVEILETEPAVRDEGAARRPAALGGAIALRRLTFAYETARGPVLRDVSLEVPAGAWVALVGPTGAGKSTLAALLVRLWDPPRDTVFLDGREIHTIPLADLRRAIGVVPQDAFLFSRSLAENVALAAGDGGGGGDGEAADPPGGPAATAPRPERYRRPAPSGDAGGPWGGRVEEAGRLAGLLEDVRRLPAGWHTVVGERGVTLSGGQRQRAALARALYRDPAILILDDPFAAVDADKEAEILAALRAARRGRTTLVITHRLRAAQVADRVVVLEDGRVVDEGTHAVLLAAGGLYARLWRRQRLEALLTGAGSPTGEAGATDGPRPGHAGDPGPDQRSARGEGGEPGHGGDGTRGGGCAGPPRPLSGAAEESRAADSGEAGSDAAPQGPPGRPAIRPAGPPDHPEGARP